MSARNEYLLVGAGLFNAVLAHELHAAGKKVRVIEERAHVGGNCFTRIERGIVVHEHGPHVFHTNDGGVWDFVRKFGRFHRFSYNAKALNNGSLYSLPVNMNTFTEVWGMGTRTPAEAADRLRQQAANYQSLTAENVEALALRTIGPQLYGLLVRDYTEKMWGRKAAQVPAAILRRIPVRFTYDNDYFSDAFEGIPDDGYTPIIKRMLMGVPVEHGTFTRRDYKRAYKAIVYTGSIDRYWEYQLGVLPYRSLYITSHGGDSNNLGVVAVNHTDNEDTRIRTIQHELFDPRSAARYHESIVTHEVPCQWRPGQSEQLGLSPLYPMRGMDGSDALYDRCLSKSAGIHNLYFKGRLGEYRYLNMDQVVRGALDFAQELLNYPRRKA